MRREWVLPAVAVFLVFFGIGFYALRSFPPHENEVYARRSIHSTNERSQPTGSPLGTERCVPDSELKAPSQALRERFRVANTLFAQQRFEAAVAQLRDLAAADPGYPGINLMLSKSLLHGNHANEARSAIDAQMRISACLAKATPETIEGYCKTELPQSSIDECISQLASIQQDAEVQTALVYLELDHAGQPETRRALADAAPAEEPPIPERSVKAHPSTAPVTRVRKDATDKTLIDGDGTDSALGAYSKPQ